MTNSGRKRNLMVEGKNGVTKEEHDFTINGRSFYTELRPFSYASAFFFLFIH